MRVRVRFYCLHNAAEAGADTAGHPLFQRKECRNRKIPRQLFHRPKHRERTAGTDDIKTEVLILLHGSAHGIHGISVKACRPVIGGDQYAAHLFKILFEEQVVCPVSKRRGYASFAFVDIFGRNSAGKLQKRRCADASADQKDTSVFETFEVIAVA